MLLRNISDFFISSQIPLVIRHYPHPQIKKEKPKERRKMNTKRINYLIKMISLLGHKIMFRSMPPSYLAQGQGLALASCVCVVL
jgi:hypothetical protein